MSSPAALYSYDMRTVGGTVKVSWTAVQGRLHITYIKLRFRTFMHTPIGVQYGFIGTCKDVNFIDSNIAADFTQTPPISKNPFVGSGIDYVTVTKPQREPTPPSQPFPLADRQRSLRLPLVVLQVQGVPTISAGGAGFAIGDTVNFGSSRKKNAGDQRGGWRYHCMVCTTLDTFPGSVPANPFNQISTSGAGTAQISAVWGWVGQVTGAGAGFGSALSVIFSTGAAATAYLGATSNGVPTVRDLSSNACSFWRAPWRSTDLLPFRPGLISISIYPNRPVRMIQSRRRLSRNPRTTSKRLFRPPGMLVLTDKALGCQWRHCCSCALTPSSIVANPQSLSEPVMFRRSLLTVIFFMFSPRAQLSVTSPLISTSILSPEPISRPSPATYSTAIPSTNGAGLSNLFTTSMRSAMTELTYPDISLKNRNLSDGRITSPTGV